MSSGEVTRSAREHAKGSTVLPMERDRPMRRGNGEDGAPIQRGKGKGDGMPAGGERWKCAAEARV
jgi:hypothetical protein